MTERRYSPRRVITYWLVAGCAFVFVIFVIGSMTRLTQSGLSITEWEPLRGLVPPLSEGDWIRYFEAYRNSPEYRELNRGMSMEEFRGIFWWEYIHRMAARIFGLWIVVPSLYFALSGWLCRRDVVRVIVLIALVGLQALLGWSMVQSGLGDQPHISHFHLAGHLGMAMILFGVMAWWAFDLLHGDSAGCDTARKPPVPVRWTSIAFAVLVFIQSLWGAFVAGLDAGRIFNTFPKMGERWIPRYVGETSPLWADVTSNPVTVQLIHRVLGVSLVVFAVVLWIAIRQAGGIRRLEIAASALAGLTLIQAGLGIATLLLAVPIALGVIHQVTGLFLLGVALWVAYLSSAKC